MLSPPGGSCSNGQQCTGHSICRSGWCICNGIDMMVRDGKCIPKGPDGSHVPQNAVPGGFCGNSTIIYCRNAKLSKYIVTRKIFVADI